ncbi:uncharacterized protein tasor2 isoform X2 [Hippoglossus stenolepis]|uniref:uncharacterized protein tasor2 isoform X2 n=1 Tax=Hippoglossus stenolepis TaxID=195615 RepID=UPI001FAE96C2|nr:uncharacterized protein tasor2 isoform X2 [Hippoglossus stenolepis]
MESGHVGAARVLVPVSDSSDVFQSRILAPLQSAYLYEESKQSFKYKSAVLIKNEQLEEKYNAFREKRRQAGYSEEDLKETFGFLLFDDVNQAHLFGETGLLTGKSACTTLGDPIKGVYISMYSDCLDLNRWYQGKSGYVAIIKLTKGRVKKVPENYTQNFTAPTVGFDCHESEELSSVSSKTSSFLAFERTQYYLYELLDEESSETALSPSAAVPFAIVSFSYTDTKAIRTPQATSEKKKLVRDYMAWRGQLQIGTQSYDVGLRSTKGALIPTKLPPVVKVEKAISMIDLMQLLPKAAFETCFSAEVFLGGLYCSLYELVPSEAKDTNSLSQLLQEIKEKDIALTVPLNDGGFLILLHSSHFSPIDDNALNASEVLQGMFIFPGSRVIKRGTKSGQIKATISSEILQVLPVLSYAEGVVEKTPLNSTEELCDVLRQHMQSYAELINPGLDLCPSREVSLFPDQYDVLDDHTNLYSSPEWTDKARQSFRSYMSKPVSFQLPVSMASEILAADEGEQREDLDDNIYCLSFPEEAPTNPIGMGSEDQLTDQKSPVNAVTSVENCLISTGAQVDFITVPQNVVPNDLQAEDATEDNSKSDLTALSKTYDTGAKTPLSSPTSDDMSAELIVSITSAEQTVTDESLNVISSMTATKHDDFQISGFSAAKLQTAGVNSLHKTVKIKTIDCPEVTNSSETKRRKLLKGHSKIWPSLEKKPKACVETESSGDSQLNNLLDIDGRKLSRKCNFGKLLYKKKVRCVTHGSAVAEEKKTDPGQQSSEDAILMDLELCPLRRKTERWELKPVISECGRILVPHGSVAFAEQIQSLKHKFQCTIDEQCSEKMLVDASVNDHKKVEMEQESNTVPLTAVDKTDDIISTDGRNLFENIVASFTNNENSLFRQSDNCSLPLHPVSSEHSSKNDGTDTPPTEVKGTGTLLPGKCAKKGEFSLSKLKSVLLKAKRKNNVLVSKETTTGIAHTEPCLSVSKETTTGIAHTEPRLSVSKETTTGIAHTEPRLTKGKDDAEALEALTSVQDTNVDVKEVTNMLSVDPRFAYALGLTPKENPDKVQKSEGQDSQFKEVSSETQEQALSNKQSQILQNPPSIFTRRGRIKMLKKHQGISEDNIKKKWWLHFQTPTHFPKLKHKEGFRDNSVRKTGTEKLNNACSSTEALNLLADLALSASIDKVPPQPALEGKSETSFKKCGLIKDVPSAGQESLLHSLLRQPAARFIQPLETSSPSPPVEDRELVGLISKEHGYSLPSSFSLLLGLPGTTFRVAPLSGSTRLLHHQQHLSRDHTVRPSVGQEDRHERNHCRTSEYQNKCLVRREKFSHSRTIVNKDKSVSVTRQWKENYDFSRDSKFASVSKGRAIVRALHGPWDSSVQDISDELRLIVHMWIGLFYSRSTARFFQDDSNFTNLCSEESDSLEMSCEMVSPPAQSENRANSFGAFPSPTDSQDPSISKVLDLSKNDNFVVDQGSVILDLSLRNSCAETVTLDPQINSDKSSVSSELKEASDILNTPKSSVGLQEARTLQCYKPMVHVTETINEVNDLRSNYANEETSSPSQKADCLDCIDKPSFEDDGSLTHAREEIKSVSIWTGNLVTPFWIGHMLHGYNKEKTHENNNIENSQTTGICLVKKQATDSLKSMTNEETESDEADDVLCIDENYESQPKDGEEWEVKENPCQEKDIQPSPKVIHKWDSTKQQLGIGCNGYCFENEKQLPREGPKPVSPGQTENVAEEDNCGKEDELDCVSHDSDLSDQSLPMKCDGLESVQDCFTDCSRQAPFDEQPPQACHDAQLRKPCANDSALTDEHAISEEAPCTPHENEPFCDESADEENPVKYTCLAEEAPHEEAPCQKAELLVSDESTCSVNGSSAAGFIPQTKDSLEMRGSNDPDDQKTKSVVLERKDNNASQEELFHHQSHSPPSEVIKKDEAEEASTKETNLKMNITNEELEKAHKEVVIPFIATDVVQLHISNPQGKIDVQGQKGIPFNSETAHPDKLTEVSSSSIMYRKEEEVNAGTISLLDGSKTNQSLVFGSEADNRCPTPTLDEVPCDCIPCSLPGGSTEKTCINITARCLSRSSTPLNLEKPLEQKLCYPSRVHRDPSPHYVQHSDEQRTLNVLKCLETFLSNSKRTDKSNQIETTDTKNGLDQKPNLSSKHLSTSSADIMNNKLGNLKPVVVSTSTSQELPKESSGHLVSSLKNKLEEVLGPQHSFERTDITKDTSIGQDDCHSYRSTPSAQCLQTIKPNIDQDGHKTTSESNLNDGPGSFNQRPVMAVKPSKNDESQSDHSSKDGQIEYSPTNAPPTTMPLEKTECFIENSGLNDENQKLSEFSTKGYQLSIVNDGNSNSDEATLAPLDPPDKYQRGSMILSSALSKQSVELAKSDQHQGFFTHSLLEKVGETIKENPKMDQKDGSEASTLFGDDNDTSITEESLIPGPQTSLTCTVFNTGRKRPYSFLEEVSRRCLQDDPTQASMEQECLIFSDQMKQLLKSSKRGQISKQDTDDTLTLSCASPLTVHFSSLEEQEDSMDLLDAPSLAGQKIKVDMSDRKNTEDEKAMHPQNLSQKTDNLKEHVDVSAVTAKSARLYEAMMDDICGVRKAPLRPKHLMNRGYKNIEPSNPFDFCDQMKREMDESFRSKLNSVVKKSCKTKYRFYILATSDDAVFEETKAQLESVGHTSIQPSKFFLGEGSSSSLLIVLRNEDIAEHICKVPHLLELKKSPGVQFAGIDEPDDVVNLTHQELFTRGGFLMFDNAALESLSLCDMKKCSDILQELGRTGKWKWMLHYRDSRRLKENARLNSEAKEKKCFLNSCQDSGILEFLPYHKCDHTSRDQPDYLTCLVRLQVQNISARYPLFITDATTDGTFGINGILTMTVNSFLTKSPSETLL